MNDGNTRQQGKKRPYYGGGAKRTGQLIWRKSGWAVRVWTMRDGERIRVTHDLGTTSKAVARRKVARMLETEAPTSADVARGETFEEAAVRLVDAQRVEGLRTWADRLARLKRFAFPEIGQLLVTEIRPAHLREVLEGCVRLGKSRSTVHQLKVDVSSVLGELWRDEVLTENVAARVRVPKGATVDGRERVILSDEEFARFMACPDVTAELHTMALVSRTFGGMRTSDLLAWDWQQIDLVNWLDAHVPRPKTKTKDRLSLPEMLVRPLQAWWDAAGRPQAGPVFPVRNGKRAGERRVGKVSFASALRDALWRAGIVRPLPGYQEAQAALEAVRARKTKGGKRSELARLSRALRACCLIQSGSGEQKPVDFHSFRRAYNTALADAGVNVQTAMRLAGHRNASTHMRYVLIAERLEVPAAALPDLSKHWADAAPIAPSLPPPQNQTGSLTYVGEPGLLVGHRRLELRANGLRDGAGGAQGDAVPIIASSCDADAPTGARVPTGVRPLLAPFARRAAHEALGVYLSGIAAGLARSLSL